MATLRTYSATVENLGALMHLRLNEASGADAIDSAGDLDGQYQGGVALGETGAIGNGAVRLDGGNEQIFVETLSGTITVSAFGDSLIDGNGFQDPPERFTPVLEAALEARGLDATVLDHATGGQRSGDALDPRFGSHVTVDEVLADDPDIAIVEFGTNDANARIAPATVENNLSQIITELNDAGVEVLLTGAFGFHPDFQGGSGYGTEALRSDFEDIFPALAADSSLDVILLRDPSGSNTFLGGERIPGATPDEDVIQGGVLDDPALNVGDGLHPNAAGIQQIVQRVLPQTIALGAEAGVVSEPLLLSNGTFEIWFTPDTVSGTQALLSKNADGQGTGGHVAVLIEGGEILAALGNGTTDRLIESTNADLQAGQLTHLVFTFGAGGMQLFVNGQEVEVAGNGVNYTGGLDAGEGNFEPLVIGSDDGTAYFDGVIDEFAVYDSALTAGQVASLYDAGRGGLTLLGTAAADDIFGGADDEDLLGRVGNDTISGGGGDDVLRGAGGDDNIRGDDGVDRVFGGGGADELVGGDGNDRLFGGPGNETAHGGPGDDRLAGQGGRDSMWGNAGNDLLIGAGGADLLSGNAGDDQALGGPGADRLLGGLDDDHLEGNQNRDELIGGPGDDQLFGDQARDDLRGGPGDDLLVGGDGSDRLVGGGGSDTFRIDLLGEGIDRLLGFEHGPGADILDLRTLLDFGAGDDVGNFVQLNQSGSNTHVMADPDGAGGNFTTVFNLVGVTGLDVDSLAADGNLQVA